MQLTDNKDFYDVIIIGAGAAGLMCAIESAKRNKKVLVLEHSNKPCKKILMSGGGRCNFTNINLSHNNFISNNKNFCRSALTRYTAWDFLDLVKKYKINYYEKKLGQLFCVNKSKDIVDLLLSESNKYAVNIRLKTTVNNIEKNNEIFEILTDSNKFLCKSLVIATGGLSIPTMGASPFGYKVAEKFDIKIHPTRAGLVPFTLHDKDKQVLSKLSGISVDTIVSNKSKKQSFAENILFTHRGLSGPAILQISSYWNPGEEIYINLLPKTDLLEYLKNIKNNKPNKLIQNVLSELLPDKLIQILIPNEFINKPIQELKLKNLEKISNIFNKFTIKPNATEGYRTAEVTLGGVDCNAISSKTMEAKNTKGLYFVGEVLDVTGWLGGFNFQWAWSSGWVAGQYA